MYSFIPTYYVLSMYREQTSISVNMVSAETKSNEILRKQDLVDTQVYMLPQTMGRLVGILKHKISYVHRLRN